LSTQPEIGAMHAYPTQRFPCPCCGYLTFSLPPGHHQICAICCWEDDLAQLRFPRMPGGANRSSLERAQRNFVELGSADRIHRDQGRKPNEDDRRDPDWRPLEPGRDNVETPRRGVRYGDSYPRDTTLLYYWRSSFPRPQIC
jgi:hypothetical protein